MDTRWPEERTEWDQEYIESYGLDDLPENLLPNHPVVHRWTFIGVPDETLVYSVAFAPDTSLIARGNWLLNAQHEGWEIAGVSPYWIYDGALQVTLGKWLPGRLGKLFASETVAVPLQYGGEDVDERAMIDP